MHLHRLAESYECWASLLKCCTWHVRVAENWFECVAWFYIITLVEIGKQAPSACMGNAAYLALGRFADLSIKS